jgi:hypothetical protein
MDCQDNDESDYSQVMLSQEEQRSAYEALIEIQQSKLGQDLHELIDKYLKERKEIRDSFGFYSDKKIFRSVFNEMFQLSLASLTEYFGFRR